MTIEFKLPELGEDIETGDVISVYVSPGDTVSEEQPLMEIETDKAAIEVPSPAAGLIKGVHVSDGETINVGQLLVTIDDGEGNGKEATTEAAPSDDGTEEEPQALEAKEPEPEPEPETEKELEAKEEAEEAEPEIKTQEEEKEPETSDEEELEASPETEEEEPEEIPESKETPAEQKTQDQSISGQPVPASPTVRRLAREMGVEISKVKGSGPGGRISEQDLRAYSGAEPETEIVPAPEAPITKKTKTPEAKKPSEKKKSTPAAKNGSEERVKMSKVRRLTAERLTDAWKAPHVTQYDKADITELEGLRKQYGKSVTKAGGKLTMTSILIKVLAKTLKEFPEMNASVDMENAEIIYKNFYNIGIAVDTERGLLVPVVKDADKKDITQLSIELTDISERARIKKIQPDELRDGTFTITNLGGIGGTYFSPVLNAPEVGILGVSRSVMEPVYIDEEFVPRLMLPLSLSYDHRLVDGANAIRFLRAVIEKLEEPHSWFLKVN